MKTLLRLAVAAIAAVVLVGAMPVVDRADPMPVRTADGDWAGGG
jgi:hypothetical protein